MGTISYIICLRVNIEGFNSVDLLLRKRGCDLRVLTRGPRRKQPNWPVSVDDVEAKAASYRVAATAAKDPVVAVAMGHLIGPAISKHIVVAAHRTDVVISRAAKDPIGSIGALAHLTTLTGYSFALPSRRHHQHCNSSQGEHQGCASQHGFHSFSSRMDLAPSLQPPPEYERIQ